MIGQLIIEARNTQNVDYMERHLEVRETGYIFLSVSMEAITHPNKKAAFEKSVHFFHHIQTNWIQRCEKLLEEEGVWSFQFSVL